MDMIKQAYLKEVRLEILDSRVDHVCPLGEHPVLCGALEDVPAREDTNEDITHTRIGGGLPLAAERVVHHLRRRAKQSKTFNHPLPLRFHMSIIKLT